MNICRLISMIPLFLISIVVSPCQDASNSQQGDLHPKGIGPIRLGDSKTTVSNSIKRSDLIHGNTIHLFGKDFTIKNLNYTGQDKLYQIVLTYDCEQSQVCAYKIARLIVNQYIDKYGEPEYKDLRPYVDYETCSPVAKWIFGDKVLLTTKICLRWGPGAFGPRDSDHFLFHIDISDKKALNRIKSRMEKEKEKNQEQRLKEMERSKDVI